MIPEYPEVITERERVHKRIQAEVQHQDKEVEVAEKVMLEVPSEWNAVPDLIIEDKEGMMITETYTKRKRDEVAQGHRKRQKEYDTVWRNMNIIPQYLGEHETQQDSILNTGMSFNRKKMNGRGQVNDRGFHIWCFVADVWR